MHTKSWLVLLLAAIVVGCGSPEPETPSHPGYQFSLAWGTTGVGPGQFDDPVGIAIEDGRVYVSEAGNGRVQIFDVSGSRLGELDGDSLQRPMHLEVHAGRVYIPEYLDDRILTYSRDGDRLSSFGRAGQATGAFDAPAGVAVSESGEVYVAEFFNHRVQVLMADGAPVRSFGRVGEAGSAPGQFTYPTDVALTPGGRIVVADAYNNRIQMLEPDGTVAWMRPDETTEAGTYKTQFHVATGVSVGVDGRIHVADFFNHRIKIYSDEGELLDVFGSHGTGDGEFDRPTDMAHDAEGNLFVVDFGNERIQKFVPDPE